MTERQTQSLEESFYIAMVDAINIVIRELIRRKGYLTSDGELFSGGEEYLRLRNEIVSDLASKWGRFRFDSSGHLIGSYADYFPEKQ
jgi:hypothetical protein